MSGGVSLQSQRYKYEVADRSFSKKKIETLAQPKPKSVMCRNTFGFTRVLGNICVSAAPRSACYGLFLLIYIIYLFQIQYFFNNFCAT